MNDYKIIGDKASFKPPQPWIFKPVLALRLKMILFYSFTAVFCYVICIGIVLLFLNDQFILFSSAITVFFLVISMIVTIGIFIYYNSFEYQVHGTEIIVRKGLINITENHIPFSNITNIAIRIGPFDQILGIGSILVYTAGQQSNPFRLISLAGIKIYNEVGYFVLSQIRTFETFLNYLIGEKPIIKEPFNLKFWTDFSDIISEIKVILEKND